MPALISLLGAVIHLAFTPIFGWGPDLEKLSVENRRSAQSMNGMMAYVLAAMGTTDLLWAFGVLPLSRPLAIGIAGFWAVRSVLQFAYFDVLHERTSQIFLSAFVLCGGIHVWVILSG